MKAFARSRLAWVLLLALGGFASLYLRRYLPEELARALSDEFIAALGTALGVAGVALRADDVRRAPPRPKRLRSVDKLLVLLVLLVAGGCSAPTWDRCDVTIEALDDGRPAPAGRVDVTCRRARRCDVVVVGRDSNPTTCDGESVVEQVKP
jgi:hypothetical protein